MKKVFKNILIQMLILTIIIMAVVILERIFVSGNIKGNYNSIRAIYTKEKDAREIDRFLEDSFKEAQNPKRIEIDRVGSFGNEHRIKTSNLNEEDVKFIQNKLKEKFPGEEITISVIYNNMSSDYSYNYVMYIMYLLIVIVLTLLLTLMFSKMEERRAE